ncbi:MAG: gliding motility-associated protein GldE [Rikenellaceae bacterium]
MNIFEEIAINTFSTPSVIVLCIVALILLLLSAIVSGSETAFFSLNHNDIKRLKGDSSSAAATTLLLLSNIDLLLATILVINNLVNICIVIITSNIIDTIFFLGRAEFLIKTIVVTFVLLLFGEIAPKVLAQMNPLAFANFSSRIMLLFRTIFYPLSVILMKAGTSISNHAAHPNEISFDELADAVDLTESATKEEKVMLSGILNFINTEVEEIMHSRVDITAININDTYANVKSIIVKSGFSRIPVYENSLDEICGILYVKDLLDHICEEEFEWQKILRKPYYVPEHKRINDLLAEFQSSKIHLAIVIDEYGSTLGLVSLEDIIEEIVGEISDDSDADERYFTRIDDYTYIFEGKTHIGDFERILELDEDLFAESQGNAETLAGLILEVRGTIPKQGDKITLHAIELMVDSMGGDSGRRIDKVRVTLPNSAGNE